MRYTLTLAMAALLAAPAMADPIKVGMITTLSGGGAGLGVDTRDGFDLAMKLAGDAAVDITVITEDDQQKPDVAVQIADRMIQSEEVDILTGIVWSNLAMAVVPAAVQQGKFYLSTNAAPSALAGAQCHEDYFSLSYQNDNFHEAAGQAATDAGYENMVIMAPNYPAGKDALTGFKRFYEGEVASEIFTQVGQTDYAAEIAQIRDADADAVFFFLPGGMGISFLKQYSGSGVTTPLIGPAFSFSQDILPAAGDAALGIRNTASWSPDLDNEANKTFVDAFKAEYGRLPSVYAAQGYDTANLILSAVATADIADRDAFRDALMAADFPTVRGKFRFGPNRHPIQDLYLREVVRLDDGTLTNRIVDTAMTDRGDAYAADCTN
ncbi:ABC transporter substrate binding protein [Oceaniovalibus guishaninsula JLT2003]|uniref:ABC transporter substrate binding protein n=1 Tax=Oceaniovalibus guishaninsula JLT2003 TaxID=1231392 RepID=K2HJL8_9RHOB|nr:ABC transporter substrate-binding protein [Oceaniovalibus guishaninsula]EKE43174.1 ABC transporter substrate binding protein [Oceaniovalibus guishaninsula JLT2003]